MHFKRSAHSVGSQFSSHLDALVSSGVQIDLTKSFAVELYEVVKNIVLA